MQLQIAFLQMIICRSMCDDMEPTLKVGQVALIELYDITWKFL